MVDQMVSGAPTSKGMDMDKSGSTVHRADACARDTVGSDLEVHFRPVVSDVVQHQANQLGQHRDIIILAEGIPSWALFVTPSKGVQVEIYCQNELAWFRRSLKIVFPSFEFSDLKNRLVAFPLAMILVQGSAAFCANMLNQLKHLLTATQSCCCLVPERSAQDARLLDPVKFLGPHQLGFQRLQHHAFGGVTFERCRVIWTTDLKFIQPQLHPLEEICGAWLKQQSLDNELLGQHRFRRFYCLI